jgi:hypothetical protein
MGPGLRRDDGGEHLPQIVAHPQSLHRKNRVSAGVLIHARRNG